MIIIIDAKYTIENLILLMHIMDTNITLLDTLNEYEWSFLNGQYDAKIIENLQKYFNEYCEQIKVND